MKKLPLAPLMMKRRSVCAGLLASMMPLGVRAVATDRTGSFPRSVTHEFGETILSAEPKRIVALGWNSEDILLALGYVPIAMEHRALFDSGVLPWNEQLLGSHKPVLLQAELTDFEQIASLKPDLIIILSVFSKFKEASFKRFVQIAPTIIHQSTDASLAWQQQTMFIGNALDQTQDAQRLIQKTESFLDKLAASRPITRNKSFVFGTYAEGDGNMAVYLPEDARIALLHRLGLQIAPAIQLLGDENPGKWRTNFSVENIDKLEADFFILGYGEGIADAVNSSPLFRQNRAIREGRSVFLDDPTMIWASSALSVLSIPFAFGIFFERIAFSLESH